MPDRIEIEAGGSRGGRAGAAGALAALVLVLVVGPGAVVLVESSGEGGRVVVVGGGEFSRAVEAGALLGMPVGGDAVGEVVAGVLAMETPGGVRSSWACGGVCGGGVVRVGVIGDGRFELVDLPPPAVG